MTYLTEMCAVYKSNGWDKKAYAYLMDETTKHSEELAAQNYARTLHRASARSGYRIKFLLTDDPRPRSLGGVKQANSFLFDDVDIWGVRYFYYFGRIPAIRKQQSRHKEIWWYTYPNPQLGRFPNYIIDKPDGNVDQRVWGWLMAQYNVDGLMNYALNEWTSPTSSTVWRDPYRDTLTYTRNTGMRRTATRRSSTPAIRATATTVSATPTRHRCRRCASRRCATASKTASTSTTRRSSRAARPS